MTSAEPYRPKVKICGITSMEDALMAEKLGASYLGFIFVENTPRYIHPEKAARIISRLSTAIPVGVCMNHSEMHMSEIIERSGAGMLQLHGSEPPESCTRPEVPVIKAFSVRNDMTEQELTDVIDPYRDQVRYMLFDTYDRKQAGGTGRTFNWDVLKGLPTDLDFFLAGGLNPSNISQAVEQVRPFAVDVSSGVEVSPGIKDMLKLQELFNQI